MAQSDGRAGLDQPVVDLHGVLGRDVRLMPELDQVRDADAEHGGAKPI